MLTESEILSQHRDQLKLAYERCQTLKMNAVEAMPRGAAYADLRGAIRKLEGTARQMFHWRGDDARWLRLAAMYARSERLTRRLLVTESWARYGEMAEIFQKGLLNFRDLAERPTGRSIERLILPGAIDRWYEERPMILQ